MFPSNLYTSLLANLSCSCIPNGYRSVFRPSPMTIRCSVVLDCTFYDIALVLPCSGTKFALCQDVDARQVLQHLSFQCLNRQNL